MVNEALVRHLKWTNPIGEYLNWKGNTGTGNRVIGVVKDFHFLSLEHEIEPMILSMSRKGAGDFRSMMVR